MLPHEAAVIGQWTRRIGLREGSVCLNIGSSTREFREEVQPHIAREILKPLESAGVRIVNCDMKRDDGVDEVGDLLNPDFQQRLQTYGADLVLCSNLLEHLEDPVSFAAACGDIVKPGGYCLITVPRSFPYHPDPIDTMFRPSPAAVAELLPAFDVVASEDVSAGSYRDELADAPKPLVAFVRQVARSMMPFYRPRQWWPAAHKLFWLFKPYRVSLVLLRKPKAP